MLTRGGDFGEKGVRVDVLGFQRNRREKVRVVVEVVCRRRWWRLGNCDGVEEGSWRRALSWDWFRAEERRWFSGHRVEQ